MKDIVYTGKQTKLPLSNGMEIVPNVATSVPDNVADKLLVVRVNLGDFNPENMARFVKHVQDEYKMDPKRDKHGWYAISGPSKVFRLATDKEIKEVVKAKEEAAKKAEEEASEPTGEESRKPKKKILR